MGWKWTVSRRIGCGFGAVLILLVVGGILAYTGVVRTVQTSREEVYGNSLEALLAESDADHLAWNTHLNALLTDPNVTTLQADARPMLVHFGTMAEQSGARGS